MGNLVGLGGVDDMDIQAHKDMYIRGEMRLEERQVVGSLDVVVLVMVPT